MLGISLLGITIMLAAYMSGMGIFVDSLYEVQTAKDLKKKIQSISPKRKIYGVESE